MTTNENRRRRNIVPRLYQALANLTIEQQITEVSRWMTVDTLEALVAKLEPPVQPILKGPFSVYKEHNTYKKPPDIPIFIIDGIGNSVCSCHNLDTAKQLIKWLNKGSGHGDGS